jgi:hypothetical protein
MTYLTKLFVPEAPEARTYPLEIEAESPKQAARDAQEYWQKNWDGPLPLPTGAAIYVYDGAVSTGGTVLYSVLGVTLAIGKER